MNACDYNMAGHHLQGEGGNTKIVKENDCTMSTILQPTASKSTLLVPFIRNIIMVAFIVKYLDTEHAPRKGIKIPLCHQNSKSVVFIKSSHPTIDESVLQLQ